MYIKLIATAFLFILLSCNANTEKNTDDAGTEATSVEAQKKALNDQSRACIALMNALEADQNAAYAAGDAATAAAIKARIDSAARENVKIGQKLMALEK